jgi:hypothetical protein
MRSEKVDWNVGQVEVTIKRLNGNPKAPAPTRPPGYTITWSFQLMVQRLELVIWG